MSHRLLSSLVVVLIVATGCTASQAAPTPTALLPTATSTPVPTQPPTGTPTPIPPTATNTPLPTATDTPMPPTVTPTPVPPTATNTPRPSPLPPRPTVTPVPPQSPAIPPDQLLLSIYNTFPDTCLIDLYGTAPYKIDAGRNGGTATRLIKPGQYTWTAFVGNKRTGGAGMVAKAGGRCDFFCDGPNKVIRWGCTE